MKHDSMDGTTEGETWKVEDREKESIQTVLLQYCTLCEILYLLKELDSRRIGTLGRQT